MSATQSARAASPAEWDSGVLAALYQLVFATPDREVAGVLVGTPSEHGADWPRVRAAIPATQGFVNGKAATFHHDTWARLHTTMARHYPGLAVLGWYVSRPGHGTQLSAADHANHRMWFARPDQLLLVVDSRSHRAAIYAWHENQLARLTEGPVARRYTHPPKTRFPGGAVSLLAGLGVGTGALAFLVAQVIGG
jgi:proteasome lid subunit RPN8/RPN11